MDPQLYAYEFEKFYLVNEKFDKQIYSLGKLWVGRMVPFFWDFVSIMWSVEFDLWSIIFGHASINACGGDGQWLLVVVFTKRL